MVLQSLQQFSARHSQEARVIRTLPSGQPMQVGNTCGITFHKHLVSSSVSWRGTESFAFLVSGPGLSESLLMYYGSCSGCALNPCGRKGDTRPKACH